MALRYLIKARVQREITHAAQWWADNRQAAPGALRVEIEQALALLVEHPRAGMRVRTPRPGEVRRFLLLRTQYFLYSRRERTSRCSQAGRGSAHCDGCTSVISASRQASQI